MGDIGEEIKTIDIPAPKETEIEVPAEAVPA